MQKKFSDDLLFTNVFVVDVRKCLYYKNK